MERFSAAILTLAFLFAQAQAQRLTVSPSGRYFTQNGKPFFWLGDTAWLLIKKCSREEALRYLDTRKTQGFNVVQIMLLHDLKNPQNFYGTEAFTGGDISNPLVTTGKDRHIKGQYDYWDHVEWVVDEAARRGIYAALVPVWGSNVKAGLVSEEQAKAYAEFLSARFKTKRNVIWLNGGDIKGTDGENVWKTIGSTLRRNDPNHLISFHPRGRTMSSEFFHDQHWLDFNMFQSGHRNYAQDVSPDEKHHFGEDNWRYARNDYNLTPIKPTLDGEPSYENIPQGLHDPKMPRWTASDVRRYAYWSVFEGGAGFTYGENSTMQFYKAGDKDPAYGAEIDWRESINSPGANQVQFLKKLMLSKPYFDRVPADDLVANQGERYQHIAATSGKNYAFLYTYTGRTIEVKMGLIPGKTLRAAWYDPRNGKYLQIGSIQNVGIKSFDPPGDEKEANDWVLVLEK
ncbi:glycoside hydrolase family 140 protein [soil metagenome]